MTKPADERRQIFRDTQRGYLGGVCAGLAERFNASPVTVRLAFVLATLLGGERYGSLPFLLYIVLWIVTPRRRSRHATGTGNTFRTLGLLVLGIAFLALLAIAGSGRISLSLVLAPSVLAIAALLVRPENLRAKLAVVITGVMLTTVLVVLNYQPAIGSRTEKPASANELMAHRSYTNLFGDLTLDLTSLTSTTGRISMNAAVAFGDLVLILPPQASVRLEDTTLFYDTSAEVGSIQDGGLEVTVNLTGFAGEVRVRR